jgi:hypothetical protein
MIRLRKVLETNRTKIANEVTCGPGGCIAPAVLVVDVAAIMTLARSKNHTAVSAHDRSLSHLAQPVLIITAPLLH